MMLRLEMLLIELVKHSTISLRYYYLEDPESRRNLFLVHILQVRSKNEHVTFSQTGGVYSQICHSILSYLNNRKQENGNDLAP